MAKGTIRKVLVGVSTLVVVVSTVALWQLNHGVIAFFNLVISGVFIGAAIGLLVDDNDSSTGALIASLIAAAISITFLANNSTDYKVEQAQEKAAVVAKNNEKAAAEKARREALTPEERKQEDFAAERTLRGYLLTEQIKAAAFDPDALKINRPKYYKDGVCVSANGKNRFGAYVGFQEYCYLVDAKGEWKYSGPN